MATPDIVFDRARYDLLYRECLKEIPLQRNIPKTKPKTPSTPFHPINFDELYAQRGELQSARLTLVREPVMQDWYEHTNRLFDTYQRYDPDSYHPFKTNMTRELGEKGVSFRQNDYPYQLPDDTASYVLWYRRGISRQARAKGLASLFYLGELQPGDFVIYRNPSFKKTVPEFPHDHVFTRIKPGGFLNPLITSVEVHLALADTPGYSLDRAFRNVDGGTESLEQGT